MRNAANARIQQHQASPGGFVQTGAAGALAPMNAARRGDVFGTGAGALSGGANLMGKMGTAMSAAIPWVLAGSLGMQAFSSLASGEWERVQQIYGQGMSQRLGQGYETIRNYLIEQGRTGIPLDATGSYLSALGRAGGRFNSAAAGNLQRGMYYGVDAEQSARMSATLQRAGFGGGIHQDWYRIAETTFGAGRIGEMFTNVTDIMEDALAKGASRASLTMQNQGFAIGQEIASFRQLGNLSPEGATALYKRVTEGARQSAMLQNPTDVMTFMSMRNKGESIFQTRLRMERDTRGTREQEYQLLRKQYGGNLDMLKEHLVRTGRVSSAVEADTYVNSMEVWRLSGKIDTGVGYGAAPPAGMVREGDVYGVETYQTRQQQVAEQAERQINDMANAIRKWFQGRVGTSRGGWYATADALVGSLQEGAGMGAFGGGEGAPVRGMSTGGGYEQTAAAIIDAYMGAEQIELLEGIRTELQTLNDKVVPPEEQPVTDTGSTPGGSFDLTNANLKGGG